MSLQSEVHAGYSSYSNGVVPGTGGHHMISDEERLSLLVEYKQAHTVENDSNTNTSECGIWKMIFTKRFLVGESRRESGKGSCKCTWKRLQGTSVWKDMS